MSYAKKKIDRTSYEKVFLFLFVPTVLVGYTIIKWPATLVQIGLIADQGSLYLFGKNPGFWYATLYTAIVVAVCLTLIARGRSPYNPAPKAKLTKYQLGKFTSILLSQSIFFYIAPYIIPALLRDGGFFADPIAAPRKMAHVYISPGFVSWFWFGWLFILIPIVVYFFGKRYCSWFCSCGNLAETVGATKWGLNWVRHQTPSNSTARAWEPLQIVTMALGFALGALLLFDAARLISAPDLLRAGMAYQDVVIDFLFGSVIGVGLYPFLGTRIWCRYGCPLAKFMELFGRYVGSRFAVEANSNCRGLELCSAQCPMGIEVSSFAHRDKKPIEGSFSLAQTLCIGCGGCIDRCPRDALSFRSPFAERPGAAPHSGRG